MPGPRGVPGPGGVPGPRGECLVKTFHGWLLLRAVSILLEYILFLLTIYLFIVQWNLPFTTNSCSSVIFVNYTNLAFLHFNAVYRKVLENNRLAPPLGSKISELLSRI